MNISIDENDAIVVKKSNVKANNKKGAEKICKTFQEQKSIKEYMDALIGKKKIEFSQKFKKSISPLIYKRNFKLKNNFQENLNNENIKLKTNLNNKNLQSKRVENKTTDCDIVLLKKKRINTNYT